MTAAVRLSLFAVLLVVAGLLGAGLGAVVGPIDVDGGHEPAPASSPGDTGTGHGGDHDEAPSSPSSPSSSSPSTSPSTAADHGRGHDGEGHDIEEPFEVPTIGTQEDGS